MVPSSVWMTAARTPSLIDFAVSLAPTFYTLETSRYSYSFDRALYSSCMYIVARNTDVVHDTIHDHVATCNIELNPT